MNHYQLQGTLFLIIATTLASLLLNTCPAESETVQANVPGLSSSTTILLDTIVFGSNESEQAHALKAENSDTIKGGLDEPARRLLPQTPVTWEGGSTSFTIKVDPEKANYVTARFWGGEANPDRLILFCDGKQIGFRPLGDVDNLDLGSDDPMYNGRFYYETSPLPLELTKGKAEVQCEIRSTGPIWVYGTTFDKYQKPMTEPSRGIYRFYTHTDGYFVPPTDDKQGTVPTAVARVTPGPEVLEAAKASVNGQIAKMLSSKMPLNQIELQFLARAWQVKWCDAYHSDAVVDKLLAGLDELFRAYRNNPTLAHADPAIPNGDWLGLGPSGYVLMLLNESLVSRLSEEIDDGNDSRIVRSAAYSEMLIASRDWHRQHRRLYSNQTMINDLYGIYLANRGIEVVDPSKALPEEEIRHYLYESVGLEPWHGSDPGGSGSDEMHGRNREVGDDYLEITDQGLSRELGYVGNYGEVIDLVTSIYKATKPAPSEPGDSRIREQLIKLAHARAIFRYPTTDADGNRAMRLETVVGWRDTHYPGDVTYGQRPSWDAGAFDCAATALDPDLIGYAQQMLGDNQFFASVDKQMKTKGIRAIASLLNVPDDYDAIIKSAPSPSRLPMSTGKPDFVFTDEQDGIVALKHGDEVFYASLYWRAHKGINNLARIHDIKPEFYTIATVREESEFESSGLTFTRPDKINPGFGIGSITYPGDLHSANTGEELRIAKIPEGITFKPGNDSVYAGKADFYRLRYGPYLIGMNMTKDKTFELKVPEGERSGQELVSKSSGIAPGSIEKVGPLSTVVLYFGE